MRDIRRGGTGKVDKGVRDIEMRVSGVRVTPAIHKDFGPRHAMEGGRRQAATSNFVPRRARSPEQPRAQST